MNTIGTKPEEDASYTNSNTLMLISTVSMIVLCALEAASFYLYNRKVKDVHFSTVCWSYCVDLSFIPG